MLNPILKSKINSLWDKFWSGGISNPLTAIEQISYLLFMRRLDETDNERFIKTQFTGEEFKSIFDGTYEMQGTIALGAGKTQSTTFTCDKTDFRWSQFKQRDPDDMLPFVRNHVFPFIQNMQDEDQPFTKHMRDAVFMIPKARLLDEAVKSIDEIYDEIKRQENEGQRFQDTQGDLYEYLLNEISKSGKNGQFRTPRHIIQMICSLVDPDINDTICDPACGTGGFLLGAYLHITSRYTSEKNRSANEDGFKISTLGDKITDEKMWQKLREETFFGFDFDATMVRVGLMNLLLHGIEKPQLNYTDTLSKRYNQTNEYSLILANPPFKGSIDKGDKHEDLTLDSNKTELLFVQRIFQMLQTDGRAAIVIPDGVLFGGSNVHIALHKLLLFQCELQAIISMPSGVFKPYAGVSTAVIIFKKVTETMPKKPHTKQVWFYELENDGYSLDDKRQKIDKSDLQDVSIRFHKRLTEENTDRKAKHFFVPFAEIEENNFDLSINRYKELDYTPVHYDEPKVIIERINNLEKLIQGKLINIEKMLG